MVRNILATVVVLAIVITGAVYAYRQMLPAQPADTAVRYATAEVRRGDISVGITARGILNPPWGGTIQTPYPKGPMPGDFLRGFIVTDVLVKEGDPVKFGQPVITLAMADLDSTIQRVADELNQKLQNLAERLGVPVSEVRNVNPARGITLRAPVGGRIVGLSIAEGSKITQGTAVARIVDDSRWVMTAKLTPGEFSSVKQGDRVLVRFQEFEGLTEARIVKVNPNPVPEKSSNLIESWDRSGSTSDTVQFVYTVVIEGANPGLIRPGMMAQLALPPADSTSTDLTQLSMSSSWLRYIATVDSYKNEEQVISTASGNVTRVFVQDMDTVKPGDPIALLSGEETQFAIERDLEQIKSLELQLQSARSFANELTVLAPMDGIVAEIQVQPGRQIEPWSYLGRIYDPAQMQMMVQVDDTDVLHVQQGATVKVTLDALPGEVFEGRVTSVSTSGRDQSGITYFYVWIEVKGNEKVRPGMQAQAYIEAGRAQNVLIIPLEALFQEDRQYKVEILEDGMPVTVVVQVGLMSEFEAEIKSGLEEGQLVITGSTRDILPSRSAPDSLFKKAD
ncbi:MAG: efflux RND transporter periplasmic adaptor subunit [Bacillota bacterium]